MYCEFGGGGSMKLGFVLSFSIMLNSMGLFCTCCINGNIVKVICS